MTIETRLSRRQWRFRGDRASTTAGFTLLEILVLIAIAGILTAIAAPSWLGFLNARKLTLAQDRIYETMRLAQHQAHRTHMPWQVSFREHGETIAVAVHPASLSASAVTWESIDIQGIYIFPDETTLALSSGTYRVRFDHRGRVHGQLGRITVKGPFNPNTRRCVFVSTLLGNLRKVANGECAR